MNDKIELSRAYHTKNTIFVICYEDGHGTYEATETTFTCREHAEYYLNTHPNLVRGLKKIIVPFVVRNRRMGK